MPGAGKGFLVTTAIANYLATETDHKVSADAIKARLQHVVAYIATLPNPAIACESVNEAWIEKFRKWSQAQPIVSKTGKRRPRSASTTENSVLQLAAVINHAHAGHNTLYPAAFKPIPATQTNRTPLRRLSEKELASAFRYAMEPKRRRGMLLRFLRFSVATWCRPDAVYDFSTDQKRRQWNSERGVIALNPAGRRQTKKRRATVICPRQFVRHLDLTKGYYLPVDSVRSAWEAMCKDMGWPLDGEAGTKLIRRSMAQLARDSRLIPNEQIELQLGHRVIDSVTDLYAAFDPAYLAEATAWTEGLIDRLEARVPGAFRRIDTGKGATVTQIGKAKVA